MMGAGLMLQGSIGHRLRRSGSGFRKVWHWAWGRARGSLTAEGMSMKDGQAPGASHCILK